MEKQIYTYPEDFEIVDVSEYSSNIYKHYSSLPLVAHSLLENAQSMLTEIENKLYTVPSLISAIKSIVPKETLRVILTDEQKAKIASGALKLMTKKDGSLMANLVNPQTNKIVSTISLERIKTTPELSQSISNFSAQMQLAEIAEQIQTVQLAIEEVRQGQEYDRLATAYSCQQKFLQSMSINNQQLREQALLRLIGDAEDSRNLLMQSQTANINFIKNEPEDTKGKFFKGSSTEKIDTRMNEIKASLCVINMISLIEALAYQELDEPKAAQISLQYYADYLNNTYLSSPGFVKRLDLLDISPKNYWSKTLPRIQNKIQALPFNLKAKSIGEITNEN